MRRLRHVLLSLTLALLPWHPASAQTRLETMSFTVSVSGITAGTLNLGVTRDGARYALKSRVASTGLAGLLRPFSVVSVARGRLGPEGYRPESYASKSDGMRAGRGAEIRYEKGIPTIVSAAEEPEPGAPLVDPATQGGSVDPLTATYAILRTVAPQDLCRLSLRIFDGHRASRVVLSGPEANAGLTTCSGIYRRVDGYPERELAQRVEFPFTLTYATLPDGQYRLIELSLDSSYGPARLTRD